MAESINIEHITPECELIENYEGIDNYRASYFFENEGKAETLLQNCDKNQDHIGFISAHEFSREHLPQEIRTNDVLDLVTTYIDRTVLVVVKGTSLRRPDTYANSDVPYPYSDLKGSTRAVRCGTGVIVQRWQFDSSSAPFEFVKGHQCPCYQCKNDKTPSHSPEMEYAIVVITTATHVIFDDIEAEGAEFLLNYNCEESKGNVKYLYGVGLNYEKHESCEKVSRSQTDRVRVKCITHDPELIKILKTLQPKMHCRSYPHMDHLGIIISHPHGRSKRVTIGRILSRAFPKRNDARTHQHPPILPRFSCRPGTKCRMSWESSSRSSYQSFQRLVGSDSNNNTRTDDDVADSKDGIIVLSSELSISIPLDAPYLCRSHGLYDKWVTFPSGTSFSTNGGRDWDVLSGLEVELEPENHDIPMRWFQRGYLTYDIKTCPGSSGSPVLYSERGEYCVYHSGALQNGRNRSTVVHF